jgi:hypothetical protein
MWFMYVLFMKLPDGTRDINVLFDLPNKLLHSNFKMKKNYFQTFIFYFLTCNLINLFMF